jgi:hypothetical protein
MVEETIDLVDVIKEMEETTYPFSITFTTANPKQKTGGKNITINQALLSKPNQTTTQNAPTITEKELPHKKYAPNHFKNRTRNIRIIPGSEIRKVHIYLIRRFNGKKVIW